MKKWISLFLVVLILIPFSINMVGAENTNQICGSNETNYAEDENRASGLILSWGLSIARQGDSTLKIVGDTICDTTVVKCGFKNLKVERRLNSSSSWTEYYSYGNQYVDTNTAHFYDELTVDSNYQYRVTCKHYAKKNILNTQSISNTSNIVTF